MVTKYDIFELMYKNRAPMKPVDVVKKFNKSDEDYHAVHKQIRELVAMGLLRKTKYGFEVDITRKAEILYGIIQHCLKNNVSYNYLLDKNFAEFLSKALQKEEITSNDVDVHPRTFKKYIEILNKFGLVLVISRKPLRVKIFYNILLNNLLVYFGYKHEFITDSSYFYDKEIEKELNLFKRLKRKDVVLYRKIVREFEISFIYHSLSLEGNPITLSETFKILQDKVIPGNLKSLDVDEVKNYQDAILQMLQDSEQKKILNIASIFNYHKIAMNHVPSIAGKIRTKEVYIKGNPNFKITKAKDIKKELDDLFEKYDNFVKREKLPLKKILNFAVYFHNEFQHIHPFIDGNSRTTRLITFHLLQSRDIPIFDIPFGLLDEYIGYTKGSKKREDEKLFQTMQKVILWNLKKINERLS
ncbi:Fic family protein [Candidatus Pacearchaeota archaeon]|nr:Fic family protein [Candidatus Pacearchaeota archaeon]